MIARALQYLNDALFVGLAVVCLIKWRRREGRGAAWLAATFGVLAAVVLLGLALSPDPAHPPPVWVSKALVAVLVLFPYLLFRFTAALDRAARRVEWALGALTAAVLAHTLLLPAIPGQDQPRPAWFTAYLISFLLNWTVVSLTAAVRLWRAGRSQPTAARRRMRGLGLAATGLSVVLVIAAAAPAEQHPAVALAIQFLTSVSALGFYVAFAPPKMLRNQWREREAQRLRQAMIDLKAATREEEVAVCLLPHIMAMVGGQGAALLDHSGRVIWADGRTLGLTGRALDAEAASLPEAIEGPDVVRMPLSTGTIMVWTSPYAPMFGRQELELLQSLGTLAELALERTQAAERDSELAAVVEASSDPIISTSLDGTIRSWNPAAEAIYHRRAEAVIGRPLSVIFPPGRPEELSNLLRQVTQGESVCVETSHLRQDGVPIDVALSAAPLRDLAAMVAGMSLVVRDITDRKRAERALEEAKAAADQANQAKSEYLSRMSHELRTPLNAILGFAQLLELDDLSDNQRDSLRHIMSGARHLLALINEVLDIAAIEANRLPLSLEPVAVADLVAEAVSLIRPLADQHGVLLAAAGKPCHQHVMGDRQRLKQILLNLLSNGVKYNRKGGSVQLTCQPVAGERFRITVADDGPGISPQALEHVFIPFERVTAEFTGVEGTGLGLPLSRRLAEAMGGTLDVESTVGQGSAFWVELPVTEGPLRHAERQQDAAADREEQDGPGLSLVVLYIEDNLSNLELVEQLLRRRPGVKLISAMQPQLGLDLAGEHQPNLIFLDLHLPDMSGEEVLHRLRADPRTAGIPVVVLSADARPSLIKRLLDQGARAFLTKPLDVKEVLQQLNDVAAKQQQARSPSSLP